MAKQRKSTSQQQENKEGKDNPPSIRADDELSEKIIQLDEDPSSPLKTRMTEITMYPTLPKAQSHPNHPLKDRRRVSIQYVCLEYQWISNLVLLYFMLTFSYKTI